MNRHYNVITVGESTIDAFMTLAHANSAHLDTESGGVCFRHGDKIDVDRYDFLIGGNATNVAVGLTRLGLKATLCSEIGDDEFSLKIRNCLASEHVERLLMTQTHGASNFSVVINFQGDRTIFVQDVQREHNFHFTDVTADIVYLTSLGNEWKKPYQKVLDFVKGKNTQIAFNPGSRQINEGKAFSMKVIEKTNMLFVNKEEAERLLIGKVTKERTKDYVKDLIEKLQKFGAKTVIVTDGKRGAYAKGETGDMLHQEITGGEVVERTGAGDAFATGFLGASLYGLSMQKAMEWGAYNATSVVSKIGAHAGLLTKEEVENLVKE